MMFASSSSYRAIQRVLVLLLWLSGIWNSRAFPSTTTFTGCRFATTHPSSRSAAVQYYVTPMKKQSMKESWITTMALATVRPQVPSGEAEAEIQTIRQELVTQYVRRVVGSTYEEAQRIVDDFLSDPDQSYQFIKMKMDAKKDGLADDLFIVGLTLAVGFIHILIGFYYVLYQQQVTVISS